VEEMTFEGGQVVAPVGAPELDRLGERMSQAAGLFIELLGSASSQAEVTLVLPPADRARPGEAYARD